MGDEGPFLDTPSALIRLAWRGAKNDIVYALQLLDSWPFWRDETTYRTPSVEKMYVEEVRKQILGRLPYFWPQAAGGAKPFRSDLVAPTSFRNSLLPAVGTGSTGQGTPGSGGSRRSSLVPAGGTGWSGLGSPRSRGSGRSSLLPESSSSTCNPGPQPTALPDCDGAVDQAAAV